VGDSKPFGARRGVAELAAKMRGNGRHMGRAEYNARACRLGGAIAVYLIESAYQAGISYGPDVVFEVPGKPAAGQVSRALVVGFRLVDATQDPGVDELSRERERGGPDNGTSAGIAARRGGLAGLRNYGEAEAAAGSPLPGDPDAGPRLSSG
jgi:hypothetical protein